LVDIRKSVERSRSLAPPSHDASDCFDLHKASSPSEPTTSSPGSDPWSDNLRVSMKIDMGGPENEICIILGSLDEIGLKNILLFWFRDLV
jgi:hypothetical protein